ncbi:hypothetical protein GCM10022224_034520 [Nonomuraea antimicrobica]|uniref:Uncharacterized protein n=1 Tax=Nonomuraea antimicrobica TaxID=561173 RepID=A0ABP7BTQ6_9ACTN
MAVQPAYWSKFPARIRAHGHPEKAITDPVLPRAAVQRLLRERPDLRQEVHQQVLAHRGAVLRNVVNPATRTSSMRCASSTGGRWRRSCRG